MDGAFPTDATMIEPGCLITPITLSLLLPALFGAFSTFNKLVRIEREQFRQQWMRDGQPREWFQKRSTHQSRDGGLAKYICSWVWLFRTPYWVRASEPASRLIWRYRLSLLVWNMGIVLWILVMQTYYP